MSEIEPTPCKYCGAMMRREARSILENPFCNGCLHERLEVAARGIPKKKMIMRGDWVHWVEVDE